jgi:DNA polymerase-3 subunit alpha (Gram-positive type)
MTQLQNSMFFDILFPADEDDAQGNSQLFLQKVLRHQLAGDSIVRDSTLVIFDFETTGLDSLRDRIIEVGAIKYQNGERVADFSTLIKPDIPLPDMLENQPTIEEVLPKFLQFIDHTLLVAHNAEFDMAFLKHACHRLGYQIEWSCFCTLKLARQLLPDLESKNLDSLAQHYGLSFAARHRSIGDCEVTGAVLNSLLRGEGAGLQQWKDFSPFQVA